MRILFFNQYYPPDKVVTAEFLANLAEGLGPDFDVSVVCGFPSYSPVENPLPKELIAREKLNGVNVIRTWTTSLNRAAMTGRLTNYFTFLLSSCVGGVICTGKQDIVVSKTDPPIIGLAGYVVSRLKRAPFIYIVTDVYPEVATVLGILGKGLPTKIFARISQFLLRHADRIVALGETMRQRLIVKGADPCKVAVITDWADTELITPQDKYNPFSIRHGLYEKFVVLHSGNIGLSQDLDNLVRAAELLRQYQDILFLIIGDGVTKAKLVSTVSDQSLQNVRFLPYQDKSELKYSLASADVSVVSLKRGLAGYIVPSKIYGILASGRPVLAAVEDESEIAQIVRGEDCGVVVRPGDPDRLAEAVMHCYKNPEELGRFGSNARRAAEEKYSLKVALSKYRSLFREFSIARRTNTA